MDGSKVAVSQQFFHKPVTLLQAPLQKSSSTFASLELTLSIVGHLPVTLNS